MSQDVTKLGVVDFFRLFSERSLSPKELTQTIFKKIDAKDSALNAFCHQNREESLDQAAASEARYLKGAPLGPLDGIPVTVKDWVNVKGWPTRFGSKGSSPAPQAEDSPSVAHLKGAGAIIIGKTTLPEYGHKGVTDSPLTGITRNPWDHSKTSGGSSGGAAVAAAAGMGVLHLGSDAGGSIRIPASFCGAFGFKPTPGLIASHPASLFQPLSSVGPLTMRVQDAALMMDVLTQKDARDPFTYVRPVASFADALALPLKKLKVAYMPTINETPVARDVQKHIRAAASFFSTLGLVEEIPMDLPLITETFARHWMAVASYTASTMTQEQINLTDPRLLTWAKRGDTLSAQDYIAGVNERLKIAEYFRHIFEKFDLVISPTTAFTAFEAGRDMPLRADGTLWEDWTPFTFPANLARLPAASIPCGFDSAGLPIGLQIMGGAMNDALVLQAAREFERTHPILYAPDR